MPPNYDPRGREWGVGRRADGQIVLIEGDPHGVDWEAFMAQGGQPLSHSHPMTTGREMKAPGKTMFELIPGTSVGNPDAIHVLPSVEDFIFCYQNGLEVHDVHTPYVHEGGGRIGNLDPASPQPGVSFQIVGTTHVGDTPVGPVLRSMLVAYDAQGNVLGMQPVYVVAHPRLNGIRLEPPERMIPVETPAGAGQVPGQPVGGHTTAGATTTPTGSVPPWREGPGEGPRRMRPRATRSSTPSTTTSHASRTSSRRSEPAPSTHSAQSSAARPSSRHCRARSGTRV